MRALRWMGMALLLLVGITPALAKDPIRLAMPPDPNALPVFVLAEYRERFLPEHALELVANPAGDPSAMRAMMVGRRMDFAFFNLVGGVRFLQGGLQDLQLVGPWVWQGIYLLVPEQTDDLAGLDGQRVLVAPGLSTPPHIVTEQALVRQGVEARFGSSGGGMALMAQMRTHDRAPAAVAAPEPLVSLMLHLQEEQDWEQRWRVGLDPAKALGGEIPLGALWQVHDDVPPEDRQALVQALEQVTQWLEDPAHHAEAARIAARGFREFFNMPVEAVALQDMLAGERVRWDLRSPLEQRESMEGYLDSVFGIRAPEALFNR
ncbi:MULTISPECIES: hypothetical protein [unclassified Ectothiorhodospira]|uniref:hypothetical protein n=1 Tax=unclassified Ectothiorhodospira TaxID=2684909 RepID=UPI001EE90241|nr:MULTISPECIES: hypothetical protein [unclassified Ectothiorhodospira]MCG5516916.1 hypothetical protein [Ectothiorhodospira sp. 9100]MCG5519897.1 hypothetical protein [Ectothiorhodospira sp. 9905]